jgi:hypothetical protein
MDRSRSIAGLIGPTFVVIAVSILINSGMIAEIAGQLGANYSLIFISGVITLPVGLAIVITHNIWKGWPVIITLFGWLAVLGGAARILFAPHLADVATGFVGGPAPMVVAVLFLVLGLFLSFKAFRA